MKLKHLDDWIDARRGHARDVRQTSRRRRPCAHRASAPGARHVYHTYSVRLAQRDAWRAHLSDTGFRPPSTIRFPCICSLHIATWDTTPATFLWSKTVAQEILSIPMFPEMTPDSDRDGRGALRAGLPAGVGSGA